MATADDETLAPPVLVEQRGDARQRARDHRNGAAMVPIGRHAESPGTIVVTLTGDVLRPGVGEVAIGTPLRDVIEDVGGGAATGRSIVASARRCVDRRAHRRPSRRRTQLRGDGRGGLGARFGQLHRLRQRRRPGRGRGRRVALPRGRIVRTVHAVQAGRPRDRERPLVPLPTGTRPRRRSTSIYKRLGTVADGACATSAAQHEDLSSESLLAGSPM